MSSASSITSELSSAAPLASQWTQGPAVAEPSDGQPFGTFLDADDTPPRTAAQSAGTAPQFAPIIGSGGTGAQVTKTAAADTVAPRAKALDGARWAKWRAAHTTADGASDDESRTGPAAATPSSASPADSSSNADAPANAGKSAATQPGSTNADVAAAAAGSAAATANALALAASDSAASMQNSKIGAGKDDDRDDGAAASAGQAPAWGAQPQALAAAFVLNTGTGAAAAFGARAAGDAHGQSVTKPGVSSGSAQNATADAKNAAPAKSPTAATASDDQAGASASSDAGSGPSGTTANTSALTTAQQQAQVQGTDNTALTALSGAVAAGGAASGGRAAQFSSALAAASAPGGAGPATSAAAGAMASFGLAADNATGAAASTGAADGGVAVPLAGLAVAIAARAQGGTNRFDIRLDPPELGRIEVRLGVDGKGQVTSHVTVDRADTLQLLQSQQSQLQRALEQAGLKTADNGLQFTLRDQSFAGQNNGGSGSGQQSATQLVIPDSGAAPVDTAQIYSRLRLGGGLDIRV